jgi:hypothetical protein
MSRQKASVSLKNDPQPMPRDVTLWLDSFPKGDVEVRIQDLEAQAVKIQAELATLRKLRNVWVHLNKVAAKDAPSDWNSLFAEVFRDVNTQEGGPKLSVRQSILMVMKEEPSRNWKVADLRNTLIERGLMEDTKRDRHNFDVSLGTLFKKRDVTRIAKATYALSHDREEI